MAVQARISATLTILQHTSHLILSSDHVLASVFIVVDCGFTEWYLNCGDFSLITHICIIIYPKRSMTRRDHPELIMYTL